MDCVNLGSCDDVALNDAFCGSLFCSESIPEGSAQAARDSYFAERPGGSFSSAAPSSVPRSAADRREESKASGGAPPIRFGKSFILLTRLEMFFCLLNDLTRYCMVLAL